MTEHFSRGVRRLFHRKLEMAKSFDLATSPSHLLRRANQYANDLYANEQEAKGLTQRQLAVLYAVDQQEGVSQTQLVRATGIGT